METEKRLLEDGTVQTSHVVGMNLRIPIGLERKEDYAISALRRQLPHSLEVVEGSESARVSGANPWITEEYTELVATDVRGVLFPVVHKYEERKSERIIAERWVASCRVWGDPVPLGPKYYVKPHA